MGFTNYWNRKEGTALNRKVFRKAVKDINKLRSDLIPKIQRNEDDPNPPIFNDSEIFFNGIGSEGCETFHVNRRDTRGFEYCKTERRPYTSFTCCCLIVLSHYFGDDFKVRSDDNVRTKEGEGMSIWEFAIMDCQKVLGYGDKFELDT